MIGKENFIKYINFIKKMNDSENRIHDVLSEEITDFRGGFLYCKYEGMFVNLLREVMNDENDWIDYFLYDLDFGRTWKEGAITDVDGTDIALSTPEDLWNLLTNSKNI